MEEAQDAWDKSFMSKTKEEQDAWANKCGERQRHYMRLEFDYTLEDQDDDELWEKAKNLPIDPDNRHDRLRRVVLRRKGMSKEEAMKVDFEKDWQEAIKEADSRKLLTKEELLERIRKS